MKLPRIPINTPVLSPNLMHAPLRLHPRLRRLAAAAAVAALALALAAGSFTAPAPAFAQSNAKAAKLYEDALGRYEKRDHAGAIIQLRNALKIDKNMLPVHVLLGKALLANHELVAAEVAFTDATRLGVDRAEVVVPMARAVAAQGKQPLLLSEARFTPAGLPGAVQVPLLLLRASASADLGDTRAALAAINEARAIQPDSADAWAAEVPVRLRQREIAEATTAADRALALAPDAAEPHYLRGTVAHLQGDAAGALRRYDDALKRDPEHTEALVSRAGMLIDQRLLDKARADVALLVKSAPLDPRGFYLQALLAEMAGDSVASRAALAKVVGVVDPVPLEFLRYRPQVLILGGLAHHGLGQRERALPYLEAAQRAQPRSAVAKLLAQLYLADKNNDRAIEALGDYLRQNPGDAQAMLMLASAHMAQGRHARATQLMQDALKVADRPDLRTMLGMSLVGGGKFNDALGQFDAAFKRDPGNLQAGVALATLQLQSNQAARAARTTEALLKMHARNAGVQQLHGTALARLGNTAGAKTAFEAALRIDPNFHAAQVGLARLDGAAGRLEPAAQRLAQVLAADDKHTEALGDLASLYEAQGKVAEAQRLYEKADDLSTGNDPAAALALLEFHLRGNRLDGAREALRRATNKAPDALAVMLAQARVNLAGGEAVAARTVLARASAVAQFNPGVLLQIAVLQQSAGSLPGAVQSLSKALQERPDFLPAQALMAELELRQGELAKAEQRARQIASNHAKLGVGPALLGDIALARGQRAAALDAYRRAHQLEPTTTSLLRLHGALAAAEPAAALRLADDWIKGHPKDATVRRALADGHARAGNLGAARAAYEALLAQQPNNAEALNNLANVLVLQNQPVEALKVAEKALALNPGAPHLLGTTGWAAFKTGQNDRALQLLRDARLRDPGNAETRYFLGSVLAAAGRKNEARNELEEALKSGRLASAKEAQALLQTLR